MRRRKRYFIVSKQQRYFLSWNPIHFKLSVELKRFPPTHLVTFKKNLLSCFPLTLALRVCCSIQEIVFYLSPQLSSSFNYTSRKSWNYRLWLRRTCPSLYQSICSSCRLSHKSRYSRTYKFCYRKLRKRTYFSLLLLDLSMTFDCVSPSILLLECGENHWIYSNCIHPQLAICSLQ